ncbi:MAG: hypothetical protein Kow00105_15060 [Phycisphaeraceae bacterium]
MLLKLMKSDHVKQSDELRELDLELRRQAIAQREMLDQTELPVGHYPAKRMTSHRPPAMNTDRLRVWFRWAPVACTVILAGFGMWLAVSATRGPVALHETREVFQRSLTQLWEPIESQVRTTGQALRSQTQQLSRLPGKAPAVDQVFGRIGESIQSPIQEEIRRFSRDLTRPWFYLAEQLPLPSSSARADEHASG